jgi:hypothetical protein
MLPLWPGKTEVAVNLLDQHLGQALSAKQIAAYTGLDVKTVRKYYQELGGIRVGSRIVFFEKEFINAIQAQSQVVCPGSEGGAERERVFQTKKEGRRLGSRHATKTRKRMVQEDRHGLYG